MKLEHHIAGIRAAVRQARKNGHSVAFVPTMGNLHAGHIELVHEARRRADYVVTSIFVNPTQFGAGEDFDSYPRTLDADSALLAQAHCDLLFAPSAEEMYPLGRSQLTTVSVSGITDQLCGASRPGHFTGVATVVTKLLNIVQPDLALFGEKDFQQLAVIRQLVQDLCLPIGIIGVPTCRAEDGLALSSRNGYLSPDERKRAPQLFQALQEIRQAWESGMDDILSLCAEAREHLQQAGFEVDYLQAMTPGLHPPQPDSTQLVLLVAARLGKTRLIDNLGCQRKPT